MRRGAGCFFFWVNQNPSAPGARLIRTEWRCFKRSNFAAHWLHAIDRNAIVRRVFKGYAEPLLRASLPHFSLGRSPEVLEEVTPKTDPAAAVAELAKLGITPGEPDGDGKRWLTYQEGGKRVPAGNRDPHFQG